METTYFGLFATFTTYLLLISLKITTCLLLLSSNVGKVAEFWTLPFPEFPLNKLCLIKNESKYRFE